MLLMELMFDRIFYSIYRKIGFFHFADIKNYHICQYGQIILFDQNVFQPLKIKVLSSAIFSKKKEKTQ